MLEQKIMWGNNNQPTLSSSTYKLSAARSFSVLDSQIQRMAEQTDQGWDQDNPFQHSIGMPR